MILTNKHEYSIIPYYKIGDTLFFLWLRVDSIYKISSSQVKHFSPGAIRLQSRNPELYLKRSEWQKKIGLGMCGASAILFGAGLFTKKEEFYWPAAGVLALGLGFTTSSLISEKRYRIITLAIPFKEHLRPPL